MIKKAIIVIGIILILSKLFNPKNKNSNTQFDMENRKFTDADLQKAFDNATKKFGANYSKQAEQLYRKETRNFDSGQFRKTFSAGMEISKGTAEKGEPFIFPYGWSSLKKFIDLYPEYNGDFYTVTFVNGENKTGKTKTFIGFPNLTSAIAFMTWRISQMKHAGYWRSTKPEIADKYKASLSAFKTTFT